jgi:hypothetical protein
LGLQTKLKMNEPGDIYEMEADRVADQVMAASAHPVVNGNLPRIQRFSGPSNGQMDPAPASVERALSSSGRPLEPVLRQDMGQRFGHDFARVRVHADGAAEQSARDVNANAYTVGHDIVFGAGGFAPGSYDGRRLIAHELAHVVQQGGAAHTVQRAPILAPAGDATKPTATKSGGPKAISSSVNSYVDLFNGFQDLAAAAINRGGVGLDSTRFGGDLSASHRALLSRIRAVLIQAQEQDKEHRLAAAAAWPALVAKLQQAVTEATRMHLSGEALAAVTDDIAILGRKYVHAQAGKAEPEVESFGDYADTVHGMNELLWIFGQIGETGEGLIREEVPNRKETVISSAVLGSNAKQRAALEKVEFGSRLNARHAKVLNTLRNALILARSEAPGSAYKALSLWRSIEGDLQHVLARAPVYQVQFDVEGVKAEMDSATQVLASHYAAVHRENVGVALTKPRAPEQVKAEREVTKAAGPAVAAGLQESHAVEDFQYALTITEQHLAPSKDRPGEWILTSGPTVIRVRADQAEQLRATVAKQLKAYMAEQVKAMVRVWETYDSIQRGNSPFKLAYLGGWGGATDPGDQSHFKDSLIRVRDQKVYPLIDQGRFVEAFKWIMVQKGVVDRQAKEVNDYDSDLDVGYSRLAIAAGIVQVALTALVPVAGEAALAGEAGVLAVGGTAVASGAVGAGAGELVRQVASGEDLDLGKAGKTAISGGVIGLGAVGPAAAKGLTKLIAPAGLIAPEVGTTALVGANAVASGTVGAIQSKLSGGSAIEGFAGGYVGSLAGSATSRALGPLAEKPVAKTLIAGGVGAGAAALTGGDPVAGAVGGITGALAEGHADAKPAAERPTPALEPPAERPTPVLEPPAERPTPVLEPPAERPTPVLEPPAEPAQTQGLSGSTMAPRRADYTPGDETSGLARARARSRARRFYAKDPLAPRAGAPKGRPKPSAKGGQTPIDEPFIIERPEPVGPVKTRKPPGFETGPWKPAKAAVKPGTAEGLETAVPKTGRPQTREVTEEEQKYGIPTPEGWKRVRGATPPANLEVLATKYPVIEGMPDPALPGMTVSGPAQMDHIVSVDRIRKMEGFAYLDTPQQLEVLNMVENFVPLSPAANRSKNSRSFSEWLEHKGTGTKVDPQFSADMIELEGKVEVLIRARIDTLVRQKMQVHQLEQ